MWKSDDEESNLLDSVVNWAHPNPPTPMRPSSSTKTASMSPGVQMPPLPPPSPFSELFPQELLQSSGLLLSQFDDDVISDGHNPNSVNNSETGFRHPVDTSNGTISGHSVSAQRLSAIATPTSGAYRCAECKFATDDRRLFMCHKRSKHAGEKTFSCPDCSAKFTRQYSLKKHVLQKHATAVANPASQLPKYCPFPNCKYSTRNPISMQLHKRTHQQLYYCKECNARYTRRQSLLGHLTKHHGSNAALIGMRPSLPISNVADDQSLQSPPPAITTTSSSMAPSFFQQNGAHSIQANNQNIHRVNEDDDCYDDRHQSSAAAGGTTKSSLQSGHDADSMSMNSLAVAETVASIAEEPLVTKFFCDKCQFAATSLRRLYAHKISFHRGAKEKLIAKSTHQICPHCPRKFASLKRMLTHVKKIHTPAIKEQRKRSSRTGAKKRRKQPKRNSASMDMLCNQCDFTTSSKRIFAAHVKSHAAENEDRGQDHSARKPGSIAKRYSPDRNLLEAPTTTASLVNSPSYISAVSPSAFDFYHNGAGARQNGSGSSTHSTNSIGEISAANGGSFGRFFVINRNSGSAPSTNSFASDHSIPNNRPIRLDLNGQGDNGLDEMASCLQGLQQANGALMHLLRRRDTELRSLRSNVVELLRLLLPNNQAFHHLLNLDNVDEMVSNALNRILTEAASHK